MDFEALDAIAQKLMKRRKSHIEREIGSIYDHGKRVSRLILTLRKEERPADDSTDDILRLAAMFHDIGKGIEPHAQFGPPIMLQAVEGMVSPEEAREAARLIAAHCDRRPEEPLHDFWARLLQDADLLDHIGTYNIWMDICYYAYREEGVEAEAAFLKEYAQEYAQKHRKLLNFSSSRRIYDDRVGFYLEFARRFQAEARGEVYKKEE